MPARYVVRAAVAGELPPAPPPVGLTDRQRAFFRLARDLVRAAAAPVPVTAIARAFGIPSANAQAFLDRLAERGHARALPRRDRGWVL